MSKFNSKVIEKNKVENLAGGEAFSQSKELEFASILLTSFVQDQFYRSENDSIDRVIELIEGMDDKLFAAKAAVYARKEFGMRSISHVVAGEIIRLVKGEEWTKNFIGKVVNRPDDLTEILSYYMSKYGKPIPNSFKKGSYHALKKFDDYQIAKYKGKGKEISMVDLVNLTHPKNIESVGKLVDGTLKSPDTWEVNLSSAGKSENKEEAKKEAWGKLIKSKKLGYFALLKNLRNILEQAPESVVDACELLTDKKLIKKSLVLPFRFITAIREIESCSDLEGSTQILVALNIALDISCDNVPKFDGKTLVVMDHSGSMGGRPIKIASLFGTLMSKANNADVMIFGDNAKYLPVNPLDTTTTISKWIETRNKNGWGSYSDKDDYSVGHGTNFRSIFEEATKAYDRIVIFSDMQGWVGYNHPRDSVSTYKKRYNCNPHIYSIDLAGYGTLQFPENKVYCMAGFSEKIFDVMKLLEQDKNALVNTINEVTI